MLGRVPSSSRILAHFRGHFPQLYILLPIFSGVLILGNSLSISWLIIISLPLLVWIFLVRKYSDTVRLFLLLAIVGGYVQHFLLRQSEGLPSGELRVLGRVVDEPRYFEPGSVTLDLELEQVYEPDMPEMGRTRVRCVAVYLPWRNIYSVESGDLLVIKGNFIPIRDKGFFSFERGLLNKGFSATCRIKLVAKLRTESSQSGLLVKLRQSISSTFTDIAGEGESSGLVLAAAFGFNDLISRETETAFKRTGLAHTLVVSGAQVGLIYLLVVRIVILIQRVIPLRVLLILPRRSEWLCALVAAWLYILLIGGSIATIRAGISLIVLVIYSYRGSLRHGFISPLLTTLLLILAIEPSAILGPSGQLTFAALIGLGAGINPSSGALANYLRATWLASLLTGAVTLLWFDSISVIGFLINPILAPAISLASTYGVITGLAVFSFGLDPTGLVIRLIVGAFEWIKFFIWDLSALSWAAIEIEYLPFKLLVCTTLILPTLYLALQGFIIHLNRFGLLRHD